MDLGRSSCPSPRSRSADDEEEKEAGAMVDQEVISTASSCNDVYRVDGSRKQCIQHRALLSMSIIGANRLKIRSVGLIGQRMPV
jgi:hypothetical protein